MTRTTRYWKLDLLLLVVGAVVGLAVVLLGLQGGYLRSLLVLPLVLFIPGYALVAVLFPERRSSIESDDMNETSTVTSASSGTTGLLFAVRVALSVAASTALVGAITLLATLTGLGFSPVVIGVGLFVLSVALAAVAVARRAVLPSSERAGIPPRSSFWTPSRQTLRVASPLGDRSSDGGVSRFANVFLVVALVAFVGSVGFAAVDTTTGTTDTFTEAYLVTENESGGYVAGDYPQVIERGESAPITVALGNHEGEPREYTVVTKLQRLDRTPNGTRVVEERTVSQFTQRVADDETAYVGRELSPSLSGNQLRYRFLVYEGSPPETPTAANAYRTVQLVVAVDGDGASTSLEAGF